MLRRVAWRVSPRRALGALLLAWWTATATGAETAARTAVEIPALLNVAVLGQEFSIERFPARGEELLLWIAPGFGSYQRTYQTAEQLVARGVETWHVDLAESLFLTQGSATMRGFDGRYVAALISHAHKLTGKRVTLVSRAYGALPVLHGARRWRLDNPSGARYLSGAVLFSPEAYSGVPPLGLEPSYEPIAAASNLPLMIYQAGARGNRWRLDGLLSTLRGGGAHVYVKLMPGVTGLFYQGDTATATLAALDALPDELPRIVRLLAKTGMPAQVAPLSAAAPQRRGLDIGLRPFTGNPVPGGLALSSARGTLVERRDYRGKVTLVNFWATWCPPCVEEIPSLNHLRELMRGWPFELISVNYAEDRARVEEFLRRVEVEFPVLLDKDGRVAAAWKVLAFPSTFVIGPDGRIAYGVNAAIHWDSPEVVEKLRELAQSGAD